MRIAALLFAISVLSCGRTPIDDDAPPEQPVPQVNEAPLYVFTGASCPALGAENDLEPLELDGVALVRFRAMGECSNAGGEWLIGREVGSNRDFFVGEHICYFQPPSLRDSGDEQFGVVRFNQTAALFHTPSGWCITNADGVEPVTSDARNLAWGVYRTEAGARAAYERLRATR